MRVLVLYANPSEKSFGAALHRKVVETLRSRGHYVDDCDLYAEGFDPVMSRQERDDYHNTSVNAAGVARLADRLVSAEALVLVYPVWNEGFPAILKGFFDRVFIPGVSFNIGSDGAVTPSLGKLQKLAAVCTYGANRLNTFLLGDPPRRVVKRLVRAMPGHSITCNYLALRHESDHFRAPCGVGVSRWWNRSMCSDFHLAEAPVVRSRTASPRSLIGGMFGR